MEEEKRGLIDASAYVLFEASGDSEAQHHSGGAQHSDAATEDDRHSCSDGSLAGAAGKETDGGDLRPADCGVGEEDDDGGLSDLEDGVVDQCRGGGKASSPPATEKTKRSKACEDSNAKMGSGREGDRLFWETCLAS